MTPRVILLNIVLLIPLMASSNADIKKYPNRLITPDFGIVSTADLARDDEVRDSSPYDPNHVMLARYWQCLPLKHVKLEYRKWLDRDDAGHAKPLIQLCDFEIRVTTPNDPQIYSDRRARPVEYCRDLARRWRKITAGEQAVCLNGDDGSFSKNEPGGKYKSWIWNIVKTRKGCFSFAGEC